MQSPEELARDKIEFTASAKLKNIGPKTVTACDRIRLRAATKTETTRFRSSGAACSRIARPKTVTSCATIRPGCYRVSGFATLGTQHRADAKSQRGRCAPLVRSCSTGAWLVTRRAHAPDRNATASSRGEGDYQLRGRFTCAAIRYRTSDT